MTSAIVWKLPRQAEIWAAADSRVSTNKQKGDAKSITDQAVKAPLPMGGNGGPPQTSPPKSTSAAAPDSTSRRHNIRDFPQRFQVYIFTIGLLDFFQAVDLNHHR